MVLNIRNGILIKFNKTYKLIIVTTIYYKSKVNIFINYEITVIYKLSQLNSTKLLKPNHKFYYISAFQMVLIRPKII